MTPAGAAHAATPPAVVRRATAADAWAISALVGGYAAEDVMLPRTPEQVLLEVDSYVVATTAHGRLLACAALREYSPSLAELVSLAVAREAHGHGLGRVMVAEVERLAAKRGFTSVFAHTLSPAFFEAVGYAPAERSRFPEKHARPHTTCVHRPLAATRRRHLRVAA